jgi:hypothetical protein
MTRRGFGRAIVAAMLALSLPLSAVAAHDAKSNDQGGNGDHRDHHGKILVCHKPLGAHPVTIVVSKLAQKAHLRHGDTQGQCPKPPKPPKPVQGTCMFDAATSVYNNGPEATSGTYATGPIRFSWTVATGVVTAPGGYWNELYPSTPPSTTPWAITAGSVSSANSVALKLEASDNGPISFTGTLTGSTLTGLMTGNFYFSASGKVSCTGTGHDHD